jgi:demethylmenaquinone methyltransferase/2-methoxy-6-polyprenyl-1,4-benzoquinol methylase
LLEYTRSDSPALFDRIARRYDTCNGLLSLGTHRLLRRRLARQVLALRPRVVLDLGSGTGDMAAELRRGGALVVCLDPSLNMLRLARAKGMSPLVAGVGEKIPLADSSVDAVASAFVLRNVEDLGKVFRESARVLRPGGLAAFLDLGRPEGAADRMARLLWLYPAAFLLGRIAGLGKEYAYLPRSLSHLPPADDVTALLAEAGFESPRCHKMWLPLVRAYTALAGGQDRH